MKLSRILSNYRKQNKLSMREFAKRCNISNAYISLIENEETKSPTFEMLNKLANGMQIDINELIRQMDDDASVIVKAKRKGIKIPVLGKVVAGIPIEAIEEILGYEEIPEELAKCGNYFALQIKGDSMEPRMMEGDVVIVKQQEQVNSGDVAIVLVNGDDATVKRVRILDNGIMLIPFNAKYTPWTYTAEECQTLPVKIIGKVIECRQKY